MNLSDQIMFNIFVFIYSILLILVWVNIVKTLYSYWYNDVICLTLKKYEY